MQDIMLSLKSSITLIIKKKILIHIFHSLLVDFNNSNQPSEIP